MEHHPVFSICPVSPVYPEPENPPAEDKRWILVQGTSVLYTTGTSATLVFFDPLPFGIIPDNTQYLGIQDSVVNYAAEIPAGVTLPPGTRLSAVRELSGTVPDHELALAAYAVRILAFDRSTRFCGRCGAKTRPLRTERARFCSDCNLIVYPRLSPAIIVLIKKDDEVLLARSPRFPTGVFSIIAGFVEPGENLEETVHREVAEEVGIRVKNIHYIASEPWPFPDSLMIGFSAEYDGGEISIDKKEIESAAWYSRENLPLLPSSLMSISRVIIDAWIRREI